MPSYVALRNWVIVIVVVAIGVTALVLGSSVVLSKRDAEYAAASLLEQQTRLLTRFKWVAGSRVPRSQLTQEFERGWHEGRALMASDMKPIIVTRWKTREVTTTTSPCGEPGEGLTAAATVDEAVVAGKTGDWYLNGKITLQLAYPARAWQETLVLPIDRAKVEFHVSEEVLKPVSVEPVKQAGIKKWRPGKAVGCGLGVTAVAGFWPSQTNTVGVGAFCGVMWGLAKTGG